MATLGPQKEILLRQLKSQTGINVQQLVTLYKTYDDLNPETDLKPNISEVLYEQFLEAIRDPEEIQLWNNIANTPRTDQQAILTVQRQLTEYLNRFPQGPKASEARDLLPKMESELKTVEQTIYWNNILAMPQGTAQEKQGIIRRINDYFATYPSGVHAAEAQQLKTRLEKEIGELVEKADWDRLERGNYSACLTYVRKYPNSIHLAELDDLMWMNTKTAMTYQNLNRYVSDWPMGQHVEEARLAMDSFGEWEEVKRSKDLFRVDDYRDNHPDSPFINDVNSLYYTLRDKKLEEMRKNPSKVSKDEVERLIGADIFKQWELEDEGLITEESWETLQLDRDLFPQLQDLQVEDPNIQAPEGRTDIYLFGTPGTGKTCLLMGLTGAVGAVDAKGQTYLLDMKKAGGSYASALQQYVRAGITPGRTYGRFVTAISGSVTEKVKSNIVTHPINLVEMSGEEFALRIAEGDGVSLENMGTGATNLMRNNNRKVFLIIVDCSDEQVKVEYVQPIRDAEGNIIDERIRKRYISQVDILQKFISLFEQPENQEIMKKVDAIHFVVTKADLLGSRQDRGPAARDLLLQQYGAPVQMLKEFCRRSKRINYSTNYNPQVFTFSLGKFFLGDVFKFDNSETMQIINTIRTITGGMKEKTWWDRFKETMAG